MSERIYPKRKADFVARLNEYFDQYKSILIVHADFVGSKQLATVRRDLRGRAAVLLGKNTMVRQVIRSRLARQPELEALLPFVKSNIGFIFTDEKPKEIAEVVQANRVPAAAKAGVIAPIDFTLPAGPTGIDPGQTSFFQALNISTKIARGSIEIINPVHLIRAGERVGNSEVVLLAKLNIKPFTYGLELQRVYDSGCVFSAEILDIPDEELVRKFMIGVSHLTSVSLAINYPNACSIPHIVRNAFMRLVALAVETNYDFKEAESFKEFLANPEAFAAAAAASSGSALEEKEVKEEVAEAPQEEEKEEESEDEVVGGLFGDDEEDDW